MTSYVLGVQPVDPGYATFTVTPYFGSLSWARGTVPTPFGVVCAGLLVPGGARRVSLTRGRRHWPRRFHGRASYTRLKGVSAARRKRVKPAAVTTSLILASPAWAPSASPTSWDSEAGVHSSVENA